MSDSNDKLLEQLQGISSQLAKLELRQSEIGTRLAALERFAVDRDRKIDNILDKLGSN